MAAEYKVMNIDELTRLNETGGIERYYRHRIKTTGGLILTVDIAEENFTAALAAPILAARAKEADKVLKL